MKAQFKYTILDGLRVRGGIFAVVFLMNLVFIVLGAAGLLPTAAKITAVSLSGVALSVIIIVNIVGDIKIIRRMFAAPGAYLYALTPVPRRKILAANMISMMIMDIVTTAVSIASVSWIAIDMSGDFMGESVWEMIRSSAYLSDWWHYILQALLFVALLVAGYLLVMMFIVAVISVRRSLFYQKRAGGVLTALTAVAAVYAMSLTNFLMIPFAAVSRWGMYFTITIAPGGIGLAMYVLLTVIQVAALFMVASNLMERRMNI